MTQANGTTTDQDLRMSLVVPIHNESENVDRLLDEIAEVLAPLQRFEVLLVDDASRDDSRTKIEAWKTRHAAPWLRLLCLEQQSGQSGALLAGAEQARAGLVAAMDGDLQNDPRDLLPMIERMADPDLAGVTGVRAARKDTAVRRLSSRIGNRVRNWITGDRVQDSACGIKVFRRGLWLDVPRFNGMHRFMPTLVRYTGGKVLEVPVHHRPRVAGKAKYGIGNRALRGLWDCLAVRWFRSRRLRYRVAEEC
ncbi:MAG: glycosyltransferase [Planctomycetes bacterium]|nr:glycosyltransferase [Planctomycetota bacterium]